jgi:hypothetical protein
MLGLYTCAALREYGFDRVYCSGTRLYRSKFIDRFGAIPLYDGKYIDFQFSLINIISTRLKTNNYLHVFLKLFFLFFI